MGMISVVCFGYSYYHRNFIPLCHMIRGQLFGLAGCQTVMLLAPTQAGEDSLIIQLDGFVMVIEQTLAGTTLKQCFGLVGQMNYLTIQPKNYFWRWGGTHSP